MNDFVGLLAVVLLVSANAFFVAAEFSLVSARRTRIVQLAEEGSRAAIATLDAIKNLDSYIAATQLGITLASLALGWVGEPAIGHLIEPIIHSLGGEILGEALSTSLAVAISFALVTMLHVIMGELAPKSIALQRPEATALLVARPTRIFLMVFRPIIWVMNSIGNAVVRMLGFQPASGHENVHSAEELEMLVQASGEAGILHGEEVYIQRIFNFGDTSAREIMHPRTDMVALPATAMLSEVLETIATHRYTRYPVYDDTIDSITGVLYTKDILSRFAAHDNTVNNPDAFDVRPLLRKPLFVPENANIGTVLRQMQNGQVQIAIVLDEYGGTAGLITMEDIIEQIVGNVKDEFDDDEKSVEFVVGPNGYTTIDGLLSITEANEQFDLGLDNVDSATIGGYMAEALQRIPMVGDRVRIASYDLEVTGMEGMRVQTIQVQLVDKRVPEQPKT